ncbi:unnamed protein product [Lactuca virosa]|uniref:Uncharacterized protein n=1 Tax=Lactuca virosa TaxID=75947 RepID=A0AAU9M4U8_9ASTR|nr:unnamed protein product [Lactuca virosa]
MKECHDQEEVGDEQAAAIRLWRPSELSLEYSLRESGGGRLARTESILQHPLCSTPNEGCLTFILLLRKSLLAPSKNQEIKDGSDSPVPLQRRCGRLLSASDKRLLCVGDGSFTGGEAIAGVEVWNRSWRKALFGIEAGSDEGTLLSRKGVGDRNASPYVFRP